MDRERTGKPLGHAAGVGRVWRAGHLLVAGEGASQAGRQAHHGEEGHLHGAGAGSCHLGGDSCAASAAVHRRIRKPGKRGLI